MVADLTASKRGNARPLSKMTAFTPMEKDNTSAATAAGRRTRGKEITSRSLCSALLSNSKSNSSTTSTISHSSSCSSIRRRFPSPLQNPLPKTLPALPQGESLSVGRTFINFAGEGSNVDSPATGRTPLRMTTRSLSVSFQGKSFFFQTSKAKPTSRKLNLGCQKATAKENFQTGEQQLHLLPLSRSTESNLVSKSFDCSADGKEPILVTVRLLQNSFVSFDIIDHSHSLPLDSDCLSSGSNSSLLEPGVLPKLRTKVRGICVPARFRQEAENPQKLSAVKHQPLANTEMTFPRSSPSLPVGNIKSSSSRDAATSKIRGNIMDGISNVPAGNAPSIIRFASALRRTKKSERRIEDAHMLRLFHNRYLQLRFLNARAESAHSTQLVKTMNNLYDAWITISDLRDSNMNKWIELQLLMNNLKLASIVEGQIACLEDWSMLEKGHEISLTGTIKALKASTLRLPVVGRSKVDIHEVKEAVDSAIVLMQAMSASMCSLLPQAEGISSQSAELAKLAMLERTLLDQCSVLLSMAAELHVKQCSLRGCILQHGRKESLLQL